jgi:hypothetical protein
MSDRRELMQALARYRAPNRARSIIEIVITIVPLGLLWLRDESQRRLISFRECAVRHGIR